MTASLLNTIREVAQTTDGSTRKIRVPRTPPRLPLLLDIMPIASIASAGGLRSPSVIIFITEPDAPPVIDSEALADNFHLTPREAEIAAMLAAGGNIETIAARLSLAVGTMRFNLKRVFEKQAPGARPLWSR